MALKVYETQTIVSGNSEVQRHTSWSHHVAIFYELMLYKENHLSMLHQR